MDYTITPAPRRSLVRRLAPWTASLGLFAGGGYGVYRYAAPATADAAPAVTTATAETPNDRLLAAIPGGGASATGGYTTPFDAPAARYSTPTLPALQNDDEVEKPRDATAVEAPANPFATIPTGGFGRYGATSTAYTTPAAAAASAETTPAARVDSSTDVEADEDDAASAPVNETPADEADDASGADVARGQEPSGANPLRSSARSPGATTNDEAQDARTAFSGETSAQPPLAMPSRFGVAASTDNANSVTGAIAGGSELSINGIRYGASSDAAPPTAAPPTAIESTPAAPLTTAPTTPGSATASPYGASAYLATAPTSTPANQAYPTYAQRTAADESAITPTPGIATADGTGRPGESILEGLQTPALTIQKLAPPEIQVGKKTHFAIRVQNNSQRTAHNVVVSDVVPLGTQLIGTSPKANVSGAQVHWDLGTLSVGEERLVEMELMPTEEGEVGSVATVTFASQASATTRCTRPQLALRLSSEPRVMIGDKQLVQIELSNPGTGDATNVMLLESIPEGVTHEAGPALEFEIGTLPAGETRKIDLMLHAEAAGLVDNLMTARADANLQVQANCQFEVIAPALKVSVEGPTKRVLERPATYAVSVDNPGTASAREVQLITQLPRGMQFVSANNMGEYDAATHSVHWSLAELPANQRGTVELTALAVEPGDQKLQFATRAQQGLEDRIETHVLVEGIVALSFDVQDVDDAIAVGEETSYEVRVTNEGTKTATNVQVVAAIPPGLQAKPSQGDARYTIQGDRVVFAPLPQLAPKAEATLRFGVQSLRAGDHRVSLQVTTDEVREPIVTVESTQVYSDE